jgi:hypothetical protein
MADAGNILKSIGQNITGSKPSDPLGDIIHSIRNFIASNTQSDPQATADVKGEPFKVVKPPINAAGQSAGYYTPDNEAQIKSILSSAKPGSGILGLGDTTKELESPTLTDDEYYTLERESAAGNKLAMSLLDEYRPKYTETGTQFEQGMTKPFTQALNDLPSLYTNLQSQQSTLDNQLPQALGQIQSVAQQYSGIAPQAPNAQTSALMNQYIGTANNAIQSSAPVMTSALKDLGTAAELSVKTFPYTTLISDLLNRYAYQLESPSYTPPPINMPGVSDAIKKLFAASTGTQFGGTNTGLSLPGQTPSTGPIDLAQPNLAPASNPSSSG